MSNDIRKYIEANGFTYCESETLEWNACTAIGLLAGAVEDQGRRIADLEARWAARRVCTQCKGNRVVSVMEPGAPGWDIDKDCPRCEGTGVEDNDEMA